MSDAVHGLGGYRVTDLHPVISEAFADYVVPMQPDEARLTELLTRRGWDPGWSAGLFRGRRLVGFWLTGRDDPDDEAYCAMAGIVPGARGSGGLDALFAHVLAVTGGRPHRLEVISGNERAARAYRRLGFRPSRELRYVQLARGAATLGEPQWKAETESWAPAALPPASWRPHPPSWQNRRTSLGRSTQPRLWLTVREAGVLRGSAVLFPGSGDLAEIAVDPAARGRGVGRALLTAALQHTAADQVTLATIDARDDLMSGWLRQCGAQVKLTQDEMTTSH